MDTQTLPLIINCLLKTLSQNKYQNLLFDDVDDTAKPDLYASEITLSFIVELLTKLESERIDNT